VDGDDVLNRAMGEGRVVIAAQLEPIDGRHARFQPASFPHLGPAEYQRPDGKRMLVVESEQSMANRLEAVLWDDTDKRPSQVVRPLPYVVVESEDGRYLTSSRQDPHRLASIYIMDGKLKHEDKRGLDWVREQLGLEAVTPGHAQPTDWPAVYRGILRMDPLCLVHGVFFSNPGIPTQPRVTRALRAYVEAEGVQQADFGGVKKDLVIPKMVRELGVGAQQGYGFVPYHRRHYTAEAIWARFMIDTVQLRGYGLGDDVTRLLTAVALYQVFSWLAEPQRLRTDCTLVCREGAAVHGKSGAIDTWGPSQVAEALRRQVEDLSQRVARGLGLPGVTTVVWSRSALRAASGKRGAQEEVAEEETAEDSEEW